MYERGWAVGLGLAVTALIAAPAAAVAAKRAEVFEMESVSVLDQQDDTVVGPYSLGAGQMAHCESTPSPAVKKYPKLTSDNPLYGELLIDRNPSNPNEGTRFFFVFDESGEKQQAEGEDAADSQPATTTGSAFAGQTSNANYDLLYFDADGDLDLTNDAVIRPMKDPPVSVRRSPQEAPFETLSMEINLGEGAGTQEMRLLARLRFLGGGNGYAFFMPAEVRKGRIRLGGKEYTATLSQSRVITGRFDRPYTQLQLEPADGSRRLEASPYDRFLGTLRWIDGALCEISASPSGDKLTVGPFRGDAGTIRVDRGGRDIDEEKLAVRGFLESDDRILSLGDMSLPIAVEKLREYEIPVGDYTAVTLVVDYGRVVVDFSENLHSVNDSGFLMSKPPDYALKVRKGTPFLLDFSAEPEVIFTSPMRKQTCRPGGILTISAMIADPKLDLVIRGLEDTSKTVGQQRYRDAEGNIISAPQYAPLDPTVVITNASGAKLAEGTMPFG